MRLFILLFLSGLNAFAHGGHSHSSAPSNLSKTTFGSSVEGESPFSVGIKLRSGYEYGNYVGALPNINSYFSNDEISLNMNYEFQFRQFASSQEPNQTSEYQDQDQDYNNHLTATIKKVVSENLSFSLAGEYETSQAVRIARMINDFNYFSVSPIVTYKLENEWNLTAGYVYGTRQYPNGTYLIPSSAPSGAGEPIDPTYEATGGDPVTLSGVTDNQNELSIGYGGDLGDQAVTLEAKALLNNSDVSTRRYSCQAFKVAFEKMLFARIFTQLSYMLEVRNFTDRSDKISTAELGLQKELSARMTLTGLARNSQLTGEESSSTWEGYAQLQYSF